jgi:hypothetical protein
MLNKCGAEWEPGQLSQSVSQSVSQVSDRRREPFPPSILPPVRVADYSPATDAEVNVWSYSSTSPLSLHVLMFKYRDSFTSEL